MGSSEGCYAFLSTLLGSWMQENKRDVGNGSFVLRYEEKVDTTAKIKRELGNFLRNGWLSTMS